MPNRLLRTRDRGGFTILELLVVVGIIGVLVTILIPTVYRMREHAASAKCQYNLRVLSTAFIAFAADHDGSLPGSFNTNADPDPDHHDWLLAEVAPAGMALWQTGPQSGKIWKYVNNTETYRCMTFSPESPGSGAGSNGKFDYSAFACFAGASLRLLNGQSHMLLADGVTYETYPTPLICQEDPSAINRANMEGRHSNTDQMGHMHHGGNYVAAVDGSAYWVNETITGVSTTQGTHLWSCLGPASKKWVMMDADLGYGKWNQQ